MTPSETAAEGRRPILKPIRRVANFFGGKFGDDGNDVTNFDIVKRLEKEIGFTDLGRLHDHIKKMEKKMEAVDKIRDSIAKSWIEASYYRNKEELEKEISLLNTPLNPTQKQFKLNGVPMNLPYPQEKTISASSHISYKAAYFGNKNNYWGELEQALEAHIRNSNANRNGELLNHAVKKMKDLLTKAKIESDRFNKSVKEFLGEIGDGGMKEILTGIEDGKKKLLKNYRLESGEIEYAHTYRVMRTLSKAERRQLLSGGYGGWSGNVDDEIELDENGWPLEVNNSGEVLIDKFLGNGKNRRIPDQKSWAVDCDAIDIANWLYSEYDAYISDLRDGRYHEKSVSVFDWIMTDLNVSYLSHKNSRGALMGGRQAVVTVPKHVGSSTSEPMKPTHLNPACDLRAKGKIPIHKGRIYYYDSQDYCVQSDEPMISSRGAALYIIHMCIQHIKYIDNRPFSKGVLDTLEHISKSTHGLDMGKTIETFAKDTFNNPFGAPPRT
jgi:cell division septum initiation protein DivIVA